MNVAERPILLASLFAAVFLVFHLRYLPESLDDLDAINFALGLHQFDVAQHQPHPPGYPVYILIGKIARSLIPSDPKALAAVSAISAALGIVAVIQLFERLVPEVGFMWPLSAAALAISCPLYWFTAVRPLSDPVGLSAAVAVQAMTMAATNPRSLAAAAFAAGVAAGIRSQVMWLTVPLLIWRASVAPRFRAATPRVAGLNACATGFAAGALTWFLPLVVLSGGIRGYSHALFSQGAEDLSGVRMLWTTPTPRVLGEALYYAFIAPWALWSVAFVVLALAAVGIVVVARRNRQAAIILAIAFGPYLLFDLLFQEAVTGRYALPIVIPVSFFAAAAIAACPRYAGALIATALVMFDAHLGGLSIAAYARQAAPAFQMLADMRAASERLPLKPVLAPDRRQSLDFRRPLKYLGSAAPGFERQLAAPPQHEWLEAVKYWNNGGRAPVWFVVDPRRAAIDLVQHGDPRSYEWAVPYPALISGTRPNDMLWYAVDRPEWYVASGWALTPEAAGVSERDGGATRVNPAAAVRRDAATHGILVIGGRNFGKTPQKVAVFLNGSNQVLSSPVQPGSFLHLMRLAFDFEGDSDYVPLITTLESAEVALEQFDVSATRGVLGFGAGWHERELNPSTGAQWRWLSDRGDIHYIAAEGSNVLRIVGESPRRYYSKPSRVIVRAGDKVLHDSTVADDFTITVKIPASQGPATVTVQTDQTHVPAERSWRGSRDRRRLGLRIFSCELRPAFAQGTAASSQPGGRTIAATGSRAAAGPSTRD